jgi:hypothetical protein
MKSPAKHKRNWSYNPQRIDKKDEEDKTITRKLDMFFPGPVKDFKFP